MPAARAAPGAVIVPSSRPGVRAIVPTLGLILTLALAASGPPTGPGSTPDSPASTAPIALEIPFRSGSTAFEIPVELAGRDLILVVSSSAIGGPYRGRCRIGPYQGGGQAPSLLDIGEPIGPLPCPGEARSGSSEGRQPRRSDPSGPATPGRPALRRTFAVLARPGSPTAPSNYDMVEARLRALGDLIQVYVDEDDLAEVADEVLRGIVSGFEREIDPALSGWIGRPLDTDGDGRFTVLVSSRVGRPYAADRCHVDGYFRGTDLDVDLPRPLSNRADLVYLDARLQPGPYLETILAHEYAHAVLASRRLEAVGPISEPPWLDEAMAHLCEDRVGRSATNLDYRVSAFLSDPSRYRLVVPEASHPELFRSHGSRGASYLFLRWCAEAFDPDLPRTLALGRFTGSEHLERLTGLPFAELHRHWALSLARVSVGGSRVAGNRLDLLDSIGDWPIGGVRFAPLGPGDGEQPFSIEGTGTQFFRLSTDPSGTSRVDLRLDPASEPSLSALILEGPRPRLSLDVTEVDRDDEAATVVVRVEERAGIPVELDRLSWEPLTPAQDLPRDALRPGMIGRDEMPSLFSDTKLGPRGQTISRRFEIDSTALRRGPIIFRITARDSEGGRVVAWAELDPEPAPFGRPQALAGRTDHSTDDEAASAP